MRGDGGCMAPRLAMAIQKNHIIIMLHQLLLLQTTVKYINKLNILSIHDYLHNNYSEAQLWSS
jgi:hypothetical protein